MKKLYKNLFFIVFLSPILLLAQSTVSGVVTEDASGQPLPGVNVIVKGTTNGTTTGFDGDYQLNVNNNDVLAFSYVGYVTQEILYTGQSTINVSLTEDAALLDEVVIIGYGSVKKEDATGSVELVTTKDFNKGAIISTDQLLTGKAAGVRITNNGGQPDSAPNIRIRGGSSLSANNSPLIVIDGVPISFDNAAGVSNPLSLINPNDVESFSILKDASATAIYGSRASNGVIIITTKKGTSGDIKIDLSAYTTVSSVSDKIDLMNGLEFERFINDFHPTRSNLLGVDNGAGGQTIYNTDWQDAIYRAAVSANVDFSIRANLFEKIPTRFSLGYNSTQGLVKTNDYERYSASLKFTPTFLDDHLKIDVNAKGLYVDKNAVDDGGALGGAVDFDPTKPVFDSASIFGGYFQATNADGSLDGRHNPLALLEQRRRPEEVYKLLGNIEFDYKLHWLPELRAVLNLGLDASRAEIEEVFSDNAIATYRLDNATSTYIFNPGVNYRENQHITNTTLDAYLVYSKQPEQGAVSNLSIQGGYAYQNFKNDGNKEEYIYNSDTGLRELNIDPNNLNNRYFEELNLQSFFGRANIDFYDKYLLTLSFRADGSSLFKESDRWGYFPAAALAWKITDEAFLDNSNFFQTLKLRLGYGETGQQDITDNAGFYPSRPLFQIGSSQSQYLPGTTLYSALAFNENLTWEKTTTYNAGLDFELFSNRLITGNFDVFYRETTDLLADVPVPPGQALTDTFIDNVGETESKGFELGLNFNPIQTDNTNFEINTNLAYNRTEVTDLKDVTVVNATESTIPTGTGVRIARHAVGFQPYSAWVYSQLYDTNGRPIHNAFADLNGDGMITNDDRYFKTMRPNWTFGFGFSLNYKHMDLSSSFRGQLGGYVYNARRLTSGYVERPVPVNSNSLSNVLNFYDGAADLEMTDIQGNVPFSDYFLEDASFLRCENIVLGFTADQFLKDVNLRVYAAVNNPFIITDYSGQDPENFNAIDNNFYPRPTSYTLGLNINF